MILIELLPYKLSKSQGLDKHSKSLILLGEVNRILYYLSRLFVGRVLIYDSPLAADT